MDVEKHLRLTQAGAMKLIEAGVKKAVEMKKPQCIAVVDEGGNLLAFTRMDGGKVLSIEFLDPQGADRGLRSRTDRRHSGRSRIPPGACDVGPARQSQGRPACHRR